MIGLDGTIQTEGMTQRTIPPLSSIYIEHEHQISLTEQSTPTLTSTSRSTKQTREHTGNQQRLQQSSKPANQQSKNPTNQQTNKQPQATCFLVFLSPLEFSILVLVPSCLLWRKLHLLFHSHCYHHQQHHNKKCKNNYNIKQPPPY